MVEEIKEEKDLSDIAPVLDEPEKAVNNHEVEEINIGSSEFQDSLPERYKTNTDAEKRALDLVENFRQQYVHLYPTRMPLLLAPVNEADTQKIICSYIRPCLLEFTELYEWSSIADFVKDYLTMVLLEKPAELPTKISSLQTTMTKQVANCVEYCNVLASLLIGAGYDAYIGWRISIK